MVDVVRRYGLTDDRRARELLGEAHANEVVSRQLLRRVSDAITVGHLFAIASSLMRLQSGVTSVRRSSIAMELAGSRGVTWDPDDTTGQTAEQFISRQMSCNGGGTTEVQRNLISERLLGMPREPAADKDRAIREVRQCGTRS